MLAALAKERGGTKNRVVTNLLGGLLGTLGCNFGIRHCDKSQFRHQGIGKYAPRPQVAIDSLGLDIQLDGKVRTLELVFGGVAREMIKGGVRMRKR